MTELTDKVLEGSQYVTKKYQVPPDQAWLYFMLKKQAELLASVRSMLIFFTVVLILGIVVEGCNVILRVPLR